MLKPTYDYWCTSGNPSANHTHSGPSHNHYTRYNSIAWRGPGPGTILHVDGNGSKYEYTSNGYSGTGNTGTVSAWHTHTTTTGNQSAGHTHSVTAAGSIGNAGSGTSFPILPPYLAVYIGKRVS